MFGYVVANIPELKIREFETYRMYYCGLCRELKDRFGTKGQMTLTYDLTFLALLLDGLYDCEQHYSECRCIAHPTRKHKTLRNEFIEYAADMNILLSYLKCKDDWNDDRKFKKKMATKILKRSAEKVMNKYPEKSGNIISELEKLAKYEQADEQDLDTVSGCFGRIMSELFLYKNDEWRTYLEKTGFYLGKFIYLLDAYCDYEDDIKNNQYNPLKSINNDREKVGEILTMMMAECSSYYQMLPIVENTELLNNIVYSGVFTGFELGKMPEKYKENR